MIISKQQQEEFILRTLLQPQRSAKANRDSRPADYEDIYPDFRYYPHEKKWYLAYSTGFVMVEFPERILEHMTLTPKEFRDTLELFGFSGPSMDADQPKEENMSYSVDYPHGNTVGFLGCLFFEHKEIDDP